MPAAWSCAVSSSSSNVRYGKTDSSFCSHASCRSELCREVTFITSQELEDLYPDFTAKERENAFVREHPVSFLIGIGGKLHDEAAIRRLEERRGADAAIDLNADAVAQRHLEERFGVAAIARRGDRKRRAAANQALDQVACFAEAFRIG